jgi:SAM-dependent methyltransferase
MDLAGKAYWDDVWSAPAKPAFDPATRSNRPLVGLLDRFLGHVPPGGSVIEAGCADSVVTPYIHDRGFRTAGLDYSEEGCAKFRRSSPQSSVTCADIFAPPPDLLGQADAAFSLGLVEHFTDTGSVIAAIGRLVKPGGVVLTVVPNMHGTVGFLQKLLNRRAFDVHVPLTPEQLVAAHDGVIIEAGYLGSAGYGVINHGYKLIPRATVSILARGSLLAQGLPVSRAFSPHAYCMVRMTGHT